MFRRLERSGTLSRYRALRHPPRLGSGRVRTARLLAARHRLGLMAALLLVAVWVTVRAAGPAPPETIRILVAAADRPAGHRLSAGDLEVADWPAEVAPAGPIGVADTIDTSTLIGRALATAIRRGEPMTDARILGPGLLHGQPDGTVAVPVRLTDPVSTTLVRPGDRVDVLAGTAAAWSSDEAGENSSLSPARTERAVRNALVLSASGLDGRSASDPGGGGPGFGGFGGSSGSSGSGTDGGVDADLVTGVLVLAVPASAVDRLARAVAGAQVSVVVLP